MDLTEAEDIKKSWREYTEELYKKDLNDPDNHDDVITHLEPGILECKVKWALGSITMKEAFSFCSMSIHLEPDIQECEVKWALESITTIKASRGDGIPAEIFQILKNDAVKVLYSIC